MGSKVIREEEGTFFTVEWGRSKNIFGPDNVGAQYVRINITEYSPGTEHALHVHPTQEEVIYVLEGEGITRTDEGDKRIGPGAFVFVPANTEHATLNVLKDKPLRAIIIKSPPGSTEGDGLEKDLFKSALLERREIGPMATVIHLKDLVANKTFEPPCNISYGISRETVKDASMVMGYTTSGAHIRNQRHYHIHCEVGQYRINGHDRMLIGPDHEQDRIDVGPGDFVYLPKGVIHGTIGQGGGGQKEPIALIFCYVGVGSKEESGTVFVEPPWDQEAHARSIAMETSGYPLTTGDPGQKAKRRARLIRTPTEDKLYAAPLVLRIGIDKTTVETVSMVMGTAMMPAGARSRRHYHVNADLGMYKVKGHDRLLMGPDYELQEMDFREGDFAYIPRGEIHGSINLSDQPGLVVFCYVGVGSVEDAQRIYVEPPVG